MVLVISLKVSERLMDLLIRLFLLVDTLCPVSGHAHVV